MNVCEFEAKIFNIGPTCCISIPKKKYINSKIIDQTRPVKVVLTQDENITQQVTP